MFYGAVVVPVGAEVLGSHRQQGFITQQVTDSLNLVGVAALAVWACELAAINKSNGRHYRWAAWLLMALLMVALIWLHPRMDEMLNAEELTVVDLPRFRRLHQWYLSLSTVQWLTAVLLLALTLRAWRIMDRKISVH